MLDLAEFEAGVCECGMHETVADQDPDMELDIRVCPVCAGYAQQTRVLREQDETYMKKFGGQKPPPETPRPEDGRHLRLRPKPRD